MSRLIDEVGMTRYGAVGTYAKLGISRHKVNYEFQWNLMKAAVFDRDPSAIVSGIGMAPLQRATQAFLVLGKAIEGWSHDLFAHIGPCPVAAPEVLKRFQQISRETAGGRS